MDDFIEKMAHLIFEGVHEELSISPMHFIAESFIKHKNLQSEYQRTFYNTINEVKRLEKR